MRWCEFHFYLTWWQIRRYFDHDMTTSASTCTQDGVLEYNERCIRQGLKRGKKRAASAIRTLRRQLVESCKLPIQCLLIALQPLARGMQHLCKRSGDNGDDWLSSSLASLTVSEGGVSVSVLPTDTRWWLSGESVEKGCVARSNQWLNE